MATKRRPRGPKLSVQVTDDIISAAKPRDSSHCMIAEAIRAAFPDAQKISVDLQTIRFSDPKRGLRYTYLTPRVGQMSLVEFDRGIDVQPFSFRLRGAHVTASGSKTASLALKEPPAQTEEQRAARSQARKAQIAALRTQGMRIGSHDDDVPERVGGKAPPVMRDPSNPRIPMSRRREFGLRAFVT